MDKYVMAMDEGTTNARVIIFDNEARIISQGKRGVTQIFPYPGWVEEKPEDIWRMQISASREALKKIKPTQIDAMGLTNQRESVVIWDKEGHALYNAIIWQCRRTAKIVEKIKNGKIRELERSEIDRLTGISHLLRTHKRIGAMVLAGRGIGLRTAAKILEIPYKDDMEVVKRILREELKYARNRRFWD
jgi:glycerol kinase